MSQRLKLGALSTRLLGNGLTETRGYDHRGRATSTVQAQTGSSVGYTVSTGYDPASNVTAVNDSVNGSWTYGYDPLNRLHQASSSTGLNLDWEYDSFGNRKSQTPSGTGTAPQVSFTFTGNNNRADPSSGMVYDAAGNVIVDNLGQAYTYDAEERIAAATPFGGDTVTYQYDSEGNLVYENGPSGTQVFHRNGEGQPDYEQPVSGTGGPYWLTYVYIDSEAIGSWQDGVLLWNGADTVGTKRFVSWGAGDVASGAVPLLWNPTFTSLPFGDALSSAGTDPNHFTGKERDTESGLDYFGARYYGSSMGRWMSPDPSGLAFADPENPQSLNLYGYVGNNPLRFTDPYGLLACGSGGAVPTATRGGVAGAIGDFFHAIGCAIQDAFSSSDSSPQQSSGAARQSGTVPYFRDIPANLRLFPTGVTPGNHDIDYKLRTADGKHQPYNSWYVYEHQTQNVAGSHEVAPGDHVTPYPSEDYKNEFPDILTGWLDTTQSFTISPDRRYNPNSQYNVLLRYGGADKPFQHLRSTGGPVSIDGSTRIPSAPDDVPKQ